MTDGRYNCRWRLKIEKNYTIYCNYWELNRLGLFHIDPPLGKNWFGGPFYANQHFFFFFRRKGVLSCVNAQESLSVQIYLAIVIELLPSKSF